MTVNINKFVDVASTVQDAVAKAPNFGTIAAFVWTSLFIGWSTMTADAAGLAEALEDGHDEWSEVYVKLQAFAAPDSGVNEVKFYARTTHNTGAIKVVPVNLDEGHKLTWTINGIDFEYEVQEDDTTALAVDGMVAETVVTGITVTDATTHMLLTPTDRSAVSAFIRIYGADIELTDDSANAGIVTDLAAALVADAKWYGFVTDGYSKAEITAAAAWAESAEKQYWYMSIDSAINKGTAANTALTLQSSGYHYTIVTVNMNRLTGPMVDNWQPDQWDEMVEANIGGYLLSAAAGAEPTGHTAGIKAASGRFADITRDKDYLNARLATDLHTLLLNLPKLPNNGAGRARAHMTMVVVMKAAVKLGIIEPNYVVFVPDKSDQTQEEKVLRFLSRVTYEAELTGAIEGFRVRGTLTL